MRELGRSVLFAAGLIGAIGFTASAQSLDPAPLYHDSRDRGPYYGDDNRRGRDDDRYRDRSRRERDRRDPYGYGQDRYGYGYGSNSVAVIDRAISNLNRAASQNRTDSHERDHFRRASQQLYEFRQRWAQGNFDRGRLDKAIDDLEHLTASNQIRRQDRSMLASDLNMLRSLRANGDTYSSGPYGYSNDPYYRR
jgi:hypothetical protein